MFCPALKSNIQYVINDVASIFLKCPLHSVLDYCLPHVYLLDSFSSSFLHTHTKFIFLKYANSLLFPCLLPNIVILNFLKQYLVHRSKHPKVTLIPLAYRINFIILILTLRSSYIPVCNNVSCSYLLLIPLLS